MNMNRLAMAAAAVGMVCFSTPAGAMSLENLELGAGAAARNLGEGKKLGEDEAAAAGSFERYVRNFYRWIGLIGIYSADSEAEVGKTLRLLPTEKMKDTSYFSLGIDRFIKDHKPPGMDTKAVGAEGVVLAWYLSQHPNAGAWQKERVAAALKEAFGEKYPGREKVEAGVGAARLLEGVGE